MKRNYKQPQKTDTQTLDELTAFAFFAQNLNPSFFVKHNFQLKTALFLCLTTAAVGQQKTKKAETKSDTSVETYYVLEADNNTRDGDYEKKVNGKLAEKGKYRNNVRVGVWEFYSSDSTLELAYDYSQDTVLVERQIHQDGAAKHFVNVSGGIWQQRELDRAPIPLKSSQELFQHGSLRYPREALKKAVEGEVLVVFTVGTDGKASGFLVKQGIGYGCDEEAARVVKSELAPIHWIPATHDGKPVNAECTVSVKFKMQKE
ncbi:MAG: energy transducer TonB [Cytophagales bacterium]|jgi:hypothetical protein|nr:energy transducer TonB [Cytophagales bacterium]